MADDAQTTNTTPTPQVEATPAATPTPAVATPVPAATTPTTDTKSG